MVALKKSDYDRPIIVTVDSSRTGIGWVTISDTDGSRYPIRFGAKVLTDRQRIYAQIKRTLWGVVSLIQSDRDYLIGAEVVIETYCLPILGMMQCCSVPDVAMLTKVESVCENFESESTTHLRKRQRSRIKGQVRR